MSAGENKKLAHCLLDNFMHAYPNPQALLLAPRIHFTVRRFRIGHPSGMSYWNVKELLRKLRYDVFLRQQDYCLPIANIFGFFLRMQQLPVITTNCMFNV